MPQFPSLIARMMSLFKRAKILDIAAQRFIFRSLRNSNARPISGSLLRRYSLQDKLKNNRPQSSVQSSPNHVKNKIKSPAPMPPSLLWSCGAMTTQ